MTLTHTLKSTFVLVACLCFSQPTSAAVVRLDSAGTGASLDGVAPPSGPIAVTEVAGLNISVIAVAGGGLNVTATSMGINGPTDADTDAFEAAFNESVTFQFDKARFDNATGLHHVLCR